MSEPLTPAVLDLLAAIRDAVDVPMPSLDQADERAHHALTTRRLSDLHTILDVALSPQWRATTDPAAEAATIRQRTAATPVTYTLWEQPEATTNGGEQA